MPLTVDCVVAAEYGDTVVCFIGKGLSHKVGANHIHQVTTEVTIEFSFSQKQREKCISILQQDAKTLSHHLYHYCQRIYQSIGSGYSQLTLAQIKQIAQQ